MFRKMYQGGSSRKQGPRLAIRESDNELPREAQVRPCEWTSEEFMVQIGIKDVFDAYVRNADLESFMLDKCRQYIYLTESFVRRFNLHPRAILTRFYLIFMRILILWTERILPLLANFHNGVVLVKPANLNLENFLLI